MFNGNRDLVRYFIVACVVLFLVRMVTGQDNSFLNNLFGLNGARFSHGNIYQIFTYMWIHAGVIHLVFNMLGLFFFGREVAAVIGMRHFAGLYISCGVCGGILWLFFNYYNTTTYTIGASGGVLGLVMAFATIRPRAEVYLFPFPFPIQARWMTVGYAVISVLMVLENNTEVAHLAHLGGMILGFFYIKGLDAATEPMFDFEWKLPSFNIPGRPSSPPRAPQQPIRSQPLPTQPMDAKRDFVSREIDPILDKISTHGFHSLTPQERKTLEEARRKL